MWQQSKDQNMLNSLTDMGVEEMIVIEDGIIAQNSSMLSVKKNFEIFHFQQKSLNY
jgi:hypothetical protein